MIYLSREVRFSVDRDWAGRIGFERPIANAWAGWPSAVGIVPYLRLRATVAGAPDPRTGYVCNISTIDRLLRTHAIPYVAEQLHAHGWRMSAERLLLSIWRPVDQNTPAGARLARLQLYATPYLSFTIEREDPRMVLLTQQFEFSAAHRLHCPQLSDEQNREIFGKCNNPSGHGHNYVVDVTVVAEPDPQTGAVLPLPRFEQTVKQRVIDVLDHKHLNEDLELFRDLNPSVEIIAKRIWELLRDHVHPAQLHSVRVAETHKTWAEYRGE